MTYNVTITVSGPGGIINTEVELIRRTLVNEGFNVTVDNNLSIPSEDLQNMIDRRRARVILRKEKTEGPQIRIVADHQP